MTNARIHISGPSHADLDLIHDTLTRSYWSPGISRPIVEAACSKSVCAIARDPDAVLIGFARVVSDEATFAWLCDVFVVDEHQGRGIARALIQALQAHPPLQGLRKWMLGTRDAHGVYAAVGFRPVQHPERLMQIRATNPYGQTAG